MIITKTNKDTYQIKLPDKIINIYNSREIQNITKEIIKKIHKKYKLSGLTIIEIYQDINYGTILEIKNPQKYHYPTNEIEIKITIHTNTPILYKIDYFNITNKNKSKIYYYKNNFYLQLNNHINKKEYLKILEKAEIVYEDSYQIINNGLKIKL